MDCLVDFIRSKQSRAGRQAKREQVTTSSRQTPAHNPVEFVPRVKDLAREVDGVEHRKIVVGLPAN